jgi:hypothetical protein
VQDFSVTSGLWSGSLLLNEVSLPLDSTSDVRALRHACVPHHRVHSNLYRDIWRPWVEHWLLSCWLGCSLHGTSDGGPGDFHRTSPRARLLPFPLGPRLRFTLCKPCALRCPALVWRSQGRQPGPAYFPSFQRIQMSSGGARILSHGMP